MGWGAVFRRDQVCRAILTWKPEHFFYEPVAATLCPHVIRQSTDALEEFLQDFYVEVHTDPEVASLLALKLWISASPLHLTVTGPGLLSWRLLNEFHAFSQ